MGDAECFPADGIQIVPGQGFPRGEGDRMDDAVKTIPVLLEFGEQGIDFTVAGHVARQHQFTVELGSQFDHAILYPLALIAEGKLCTLATHGPGDAIGNGAAAEQSGDQYVLVLEKCHGGFPGKSPAL